MNLISHCRHGFGATVLALVLPFTAAPVLAGTITGAITVTPPNPKVNQQVIIHIAGQGGYCGIRINTGDGEPSTNVDFNGSNGYDKPNTGTAYPYTFKKTGTFQIKVIGSPSLNPGCTGQASTNVTVTQVKLQLPAKTPTICADGFDKALVSSESDGELRCVKQSVVCPSHYQGNLDSATGKLECVPKPVECPAGWVGGMQSGKLVCNSAPLPKVHCSESTPTNPWGASYYAEGWRIYGCSRNLAPPK
jgi:hypothetical protein